MADKKQPPMKNQKSEETPKEGESTADEQNQRRSEPGESSSVFAGSTATLRVPTTTSAGLLRGASTTSISSISSEWTTRAFIHSQKSDLSEAPRSSSNPVDSYDDRSISCGSCLTGSSLSDLETDQPCNVCDFHSALDRAEDGRLAISTPPTPAHRTGESTQSRLTERRPSTSMVELARLEPESQPDDTVEVASLEPESQPDKEE